MFQSFVAKLASRDSATSTILSRGESNGLSFATFAGILSALASIIILALLCYRFHRDGWSYMAAIDVSIIALFVAELIQAIGKSMDLKWVIDGRVDTGSFCTGQGIMEQLGETWVALATLTIAVQTFLAIWSLRPLNRTITMVVIGLQFLFVALFVGIGVGVHTHPPDEYYITPTPWWCWIGKGFAKERIGGEYLWLWVTLFVSLALYPPLFLLHWNIIEQGSKWYQPREAGSRTRDLNLWSTLMYPILYCVLILPSSIIRFIGFHEEAVYGETRSRPVATFIIAVIFSLSGVFNALLYTLTRTRLFQPNQTRAVTAPKVDASNNSTSQTTTAQLSEV